jgi:hypothetical protein
VTRGGTRHKTLFAHLSRLLASRSGLVHRHALATEHAKGASVSNKLGRGVAALFEPIPDHTLSGNCWLAAEDCKKCCTGGDICDVCHEHDEPRGDCSECPPCSRCESGDTAPTKKKSPRKLRAVEPEERTDEAEYMAQLRLALGRHPWLVLERINCGEIPVRDHTGKTLRIFYGAANGTGDLVGWVRPEGWHIEVELKSAKGRQRKAQIIREHNLKTGGCLYVLAKYDGKESMADNVQSTVGKIEAAITEKRMAT